MLKQTVLKSSDWTYQIGKNDVTFDLETNGDREDFIVVEVRAFGPVEVIGLVKADIGAKSLPLGKGEFFSLRLRIEGFSALVLRPTVESPWAYQVTTKQGRRNEKLDPTKLALIPPRHDVSDLAKLVDQAIAARLGREDDGFQDPDNALSFDDLDETEFGSGYMEPDSEVGEADGYMEARPRRLDKPPRRKKASTGAEAGDAPDDSDNNGDSDGSD